jgi:Fic-DOC domain mobile mystery protein B
MAEDLTGPLEEGQTPIDDISGLLVKVKNRQELNDLESENNHKAYTKYILFMKPTSKFNPFAYESLCQIHRDMFNEVWDWAGIPRKKGKKNIGVDGVKVGSEMHRFSFDFRQWEEKKVTPSEIGVRVHHRLVWIHPFENGNGRWGRLMVNIYLHRKGLPLLNWPRDEKVIKADFKPRYISALRSADGGDFGPLKKIHEECSR